MKLLAIANALSGMDRKAAAEAAGMDRQALRDWIIRYNAHGVEGLRDRCTDNAFALVMPYADTPAMQTFLDQFSETIAQDEHAVMILDQAGWHGSAALVIPTNMTLVPLPAPAFARAGSTRPN